MKQIESMTFRHGATLAREASTRAVALKPVSEMTLVITNKVEGLGVESTAIVTVELCPLRMRQIAENMIAAADDLEATVGPLLTSCCQAPDLGPPPP